MRRVLLASFALAVLFCASLSAGPINGSFQFIGETTFTATTITWTLPPTPDMATITAGSGSFAAPGFVNSTITIPDTNSTAQPAGSAFPPITFIHFNSPLAATYPNLNLNFIFAGINGTAGCSASPPAPGQLCTPSQPGTPSPVN